ncbi:MAG: hypothetical protein EXS37_03075 [Opitutus sp.]|nr:hypothetical protein [Opitutus sp.]
MNFASKFFSARAPSTTLGYRVDHITFDTYGQGRITDTKDPRYASGRFVLNAWDFDGTVETNRYSPKTFTAGGVLHAIPRVSLFYNESRNSGTPRLDRTVLPTGKTPPPTEGLGRYNAQENGYLRVYLNEPRNYRLTIGADF